METKRMLLAAVTAITMASTGALAQPSAVEQDRRLREDLVPPSRSVAPLPREREIVIVPPRQVEQDRRGARIDDPPGSKFQDQKNDEDLEPGGHPPIPR
jgi:hypothetical protein